VVIQETKSTAIYGGERQIAMFAAIRDIRIHVHRQNMGTLTYGNGDEFHLLYSHIRDEQKEPNHYDYMVRSVMLEQTTDVPRSPFTNYKRGDMEIRDGTKLVTRNVFGWLHNFQKALDLRADILLIQEHWRGADTLGTRQSAAREKGWHGVWSGSARSPFTDRNSCGVAVLTSLDRPISQVGESNDRMITAMVPWIALDVRSRCSRVSNPSKQKRSPGPGGLPSW